MNDSKLWITYAWANNQNGDFDYLAQELEAAGIKTHYDKVALTTGRRLWDQIAEKINSPETKAWAYLVTAESLASAPCREELAYAIDRALREKGDEFPLIGILHGVPFSEVPPVLKVRLCVNLESPDWKEEIRSGLTGKPPERAKKEIPQYVWKMHISESPTQGTLEIRPRFGSVSPWVIAIPKDGPQPLRWGTGPAGSQHISSVQYGVRTGEIDCEGDILNFFSSESAVTPSNSAYMVFDRIVPVSVRFGIFKDTGYKFDFTLSHPGSL